MILEYVVDIILQERLKPELRKLVGEMFGVPDGYNLDANQALKMVHPDRHIAIELAEKLSRMPEVQRVTMTRIEGYSEGVWRNGRKAA